MQKTTLVVPCFNEASRLDAAAFREYALRTPEVSFLFVDDGSTDRTAALLEALCAEEPGRLAVLRLPRNRGKAEAVRLGLLRALEGEAQVVGYWDADLAAPLDAVAEMSRELEDGRARIVLGSRVRLLGRSIERSALRHYAGRVFATAASLVLDLPVYDTQCGAKLFLRTETLPRVFRAPFVSRWIFDVEILARCKALARLEGGAPLAAVEHPLASWRAIPGSKLRTGHFLGAAIDLWRIARLYRESGFAERARGLFPP